MASPAALVASRPGLSLPDDATNSRITAAVAAARSGARRSEVGPACGREVLVVEDFGLRTFRAVFRRRTSSGRRLLLCVKGGVACPDWLMTLALRSADHIIAADDRALETVSRLFPTGARVFAISDVERRGLAPFLRCPADRAAEDAYRIIFSDELAPQTGAADLLLAAASWARGNRSRQVEIVWVGEGVLKDVLRAQPVPPNLFQRFTPPRSEPEMANVFAHAGLLVAPTAFGCAGHPVLQALAAGLPVIGSLRCRSVRQWVRQGETGWVADPHQPGSILDALSRALGTSVEDLDRMRRAARADVEAAAAPAMVGRVRHVLEILRASSARHAAQNG